jgi:NTP pyrophosphatase (non-canonical NTP hydrolase)
MNLKELAVEIRETNDANGFEAPTWDRLLSKLMLVVTELDEAVAAVKGDGKDPLEEELADAAIRLIDILKAVWGDDWNERDGDGGGTPFERIEVMLWKPLTMVCRAAEQWRYDNRTDVRIAIELALAALFGLASRLGIDLMAEMVRKTKRNALRGYRHGKVRGDA